MITLADLSSLDPAREEVPARLREFGRCRVVGAVGTGRSTLARELCQKLLKAHPVELPTADAECLVADSL